ncbi:neuroendocrine convertase 2 [Trichonephila clavipes]|nr:neuroendocrine convertase 2 [Trichonephila clavipes]
MVTGLENMVGVALYPIQAVKALASDQTCNFQFRTQISTHEQINCPGKEINSTIAEFFSSVKLEKNVGQNGGKPRLDLNVEAAWAQGYTGKNITTAIMDDGVDYIHPDLRENYNARASYDFSSNDPYPYPRYTDDWFNR